jgi:hypothetical protein
VKKRDNYCWQNKGFSILKNLGFPFNSYTIQQFVIEPKRPEISPKSPQSFTVQGLQADGRFL